MKENPTHPFTLDVLPAPGGHFQWAIRERGKLLQRSDRPQPSARVAREKGEAVLESLFLGVPDTRRR